MKQILISSFLLFILNACNSKDRRPVESENDIDAARNFIQAGLDGDYNKARTYMLPDSANQGRMDIVERMRLSPDEKKGLAGATINIHNVTKQNDSTTIVIYSNSFKNNWDTLRIKKLDEKWLVDFNYLWDHDADTTVKAPLLNIDSLQK